MFGIGMQELAIILVVALLVFGPKRLPELARTLGKGLAEFRKASTDLRQSFSLDADVSPSMRPAKTPQPDDSSPPSKPEPQPAQAVDAYPDASANEQPVVTDSGHGDHAEDAGPTAEPERKPQTSAEPGGNER